MTAVRADAGRVLVQVGDAVQASTDGGRSFTASDQPPSALDPGPVVSSGGTWEIRDGRVITGTSPIALHVDPGAPYLGVDAHLVAAPAALPGVVVAVGRDGHVWRRGADGRWGTAFILLPAGGVSGAPSVTGVAAFDRPLSGAVYLATAGYGVLLSSDGGDDWIRADPGLPANVLGLSADATTGSLYAATDDGLWVHHLQSFPAPPTYHDAQLYLRWLGMALVSVLATAAAVVGLRRLLPSAR